MSRKTASTSIVLQHPQRLGAESLVTHLADPGVAAEQERQLVEGGPLVVDHEDLQRAHGRRVAERSGAHGCSHPGANFGTRTITLVPAPGAVSTTSP